MQQAKTEQVRIVVNGEERLVPYLQNVRSLLASLGMDPDRVAVELDLAIVRKSDWETTLVREGSRLEIVQFVGGG